MLEVLYEDNHLIAVNKRSGDIIQGDRTGDAPLSEDVKAYIKKKYNKPGDVFLGTIHRIDRPVTGVVVFARTSKALARMNAMFQKKEVQKTYWAVVKQQPPSRAEKLVHYLKKNESKNKSFASPTEKSGTKRAELEYRLVGRSDHYYLLEVLPKTGRHHQIRVQLSTIGCPIRGDLKYGFDRSNRDGSIHLHARKIEFLHPVKKEPVSIEAPPPQDRLWESIARNLGDD